MTSIESTEHAEGTRSAQPSIVESFCIEGLYGYRSVSLSSQYAATVLIAKNGAGKTTLLGALDAFLKGQLGRLANLQFTRITCKLKGIPEALELSSDDVNSLTNVPESSELYTYAKSFGLEPADFLDFLNDEYPVIKRDYKQPSENEIFEAILAKVRYVHNDARKICDRLAESLEGRNKNIEHIRKTLRTVLDGVEIVYLPTYRRIELPLTGDIDEMQRASRKKRSIQSRLGISKRNLFSADIQFGLADISDRLAHLNQEILINSNGCGSFARHIHAANRLAKCNEE